MKKLMSILMICLSISAYSQNQPRKSDVRPRKEQRAKLDSIHNAYINTNLPLSSEEQARFWPVYVEMKDKLRDLNKKEIQTRNELKNNLETLSETDIKNKVELLQSIETDKLALKKEYSSKIAAAITWKKSVKLVRVEKEFKEKIRDELQRRKVERNSAPSDSDMN